jgi:phosphoribosylformimino-5-aminoimidazole carboxamide ribotide isomerase
MSFQVIPAIDLIGGEVVRLVRGDYDAKTVYHADPVALSVSFAQAGVQRLHVVDLEGAKAGSPVHDSLIQRMVAASGLAIEVGGGIRDMATAAQYLDGAGVQWVILGTAAVRDPDFVRRACARWPDRILVGLDVRNGLVAVDGWLKESSSTAEAIVSAYAQAGVAGIIYTDIQRDGTGDGPNVEATAALAEHAGVPIIASGGVATLDHIVALRRESFRGIAGVVVGKAILSGDLSVKQALDAVD